MNISSRHSNSQFCSLSCIPLPYQFGEKYQFVVGNVTFNLRLEEWPMDGNKVSKIWIGMSYTLYIYSNENSKSLAKMRTLNAGTLELIPKKNVYNF